MICGLTLRSWSCDPLLLGLRDYFWGLFPLSAGLQPGTRQEIALESLGGLDNEMLQTSPTSGGGCRDLRLPSTGTLHKRKPPWAHMYSRSLFVPDFVR
jgi:hypothetical protein